MVSIPENVDRVREWFIVAEGAHNEFIRKANRNLDMFHGDDVHSAQDRSNAIRQNRPLVHIPLIKPMTKMILGLQAENPVEITYKPFGGGDQKVAGMYSTWLKYVQTDQEIEFTDAQVFASGIITGRGFYVLDWLTNWPYRENGRIVIRDEDPRNVVVDPQNTRYDQQGAQFIMRVRYLNKNVIAMTWGKDKAKEISYEAFPRMYPSDYIANNNEELQEYRVIECYWKKYKEVRSAIDRETDQEYEIKNGRITAPDYGQGEHKLNDLIDAFGKERFHISKYTKPIMYRTTICGDAELSDHESVFTESVYCTQNFPVIPFMPNFVMGKNSCIVDDLLDLQREENLSHSQMQHLLNLSANGGWVVSEGALKDPAMLSKYGSLPGVIIEMTKDAVWGKDLHRLQPGQVMPIENMLKTREKAKDASGINPELLGMADRQESGRAIALRQKTGMTILNPDMSPFVMTKRLLGRQTVGAIQVKMPAEQAIRILELDDFITQEDIQTIEIEAAKRKVMQYEQQMGVELPKDQRNQMLQQFYEPITEQQKAQFVGQLAARKLKDYDATQYDIVCVIVPKSATQVQANHDRLMELFERLGPEWVFPKVLIEASDVPKKEDLLAALKKKEEMAQGMNAPQPPVIPQPGQPQGGNSGSANAQQIQQLQAMMKDMQPQGQG